MSDELMKLWNFDEADLGANRLGKLSEKQGNFLAGEHKSQSRVFLGVGAAVVAIFCCLPILVFGVRVLPSLLLSGGASDLTNMLPPTLSMGAVLGILAAVALPIAAVVGIYLLRAGRKADVNVKRAEGEVKYTWGTKRVRNPGNKARPYDDVRVLHLYLGDKKFEVREELQMHIKEGDSWIVYYTSYPFKFLSAEKA